VISRNSNPLHQKLIDRRGQNKQKNLKSLVYITTDVITRCIEFRMAGKSPVLLLVANIL
jgi:hypothetical protein